MILNRLRYGTLFWYGLGCSLILFLTFRTFNAEHLFFANDQSTDFIISKLWLSGHRPVLGPPASVGARHLGPHYYTFVLIPHVLGISDPVTAMAIYAVLKLTAIIGLIWLAIVFAPQAGKSLAGITVLFNCALLSYTEVFRVSWHSHYLILPSTLTLIALSLLIRFGAFFFPLFLSCISLSLLSHLNSAPFVLVTGVAALISVVWLQPTTLPPFLSTSRFMRWLLLIAPTICFIAIWLPAITNLSVFISNLGSLISSQTRGQDSSLYGAIYAGAEFLRVHSIGLAFPGTRFLPLYILGFALSIPVFVKWFQSATRPEVLWFGTLLAVPVASILFIYLFHGPAHAHYLNSSLPIPILLMAGLVGRLANVSSQDHLLHRTSAFMIGLGSAIAWLVSVFQFLSLFDLRGGKLYHSLAHARDVSNAISNALTSNEERENVRILTAHAADAMENSYYYALNSSRYRDLEYAPLFSDISRFKEDSPPDAVFLISCPRPFSQEQVRIFSSLPYPLVVQREINLAQYGSLSQCALWKLSPSNFTEEKANNHAKRSLLNLLPK